MSEIRIGGRCDRHPLNVRPCEKCAAQLRAAEVRATTQPLDIDDVRDLLREMSRPTTQSGLSKTLGVSPQYLSEVMLGRRAPGPKLLRSLGLREEITYHKDPK